MTGGLGCYLAAQSRDQAADRDQGEQHLCHRAGIGAPRGHPEASQPCALRLLSHQLRLRLPLTIAAAATSAAEYRGSEQVALGAPPRIIPPRPPGRHRSGHSIRP